jgi:hypothetical protein
LPYAATKTFIPARQVWHDGINHLRHTLRYCAGAYYYPAFDRPRLFGQPLGGMDDDPAGFSSIAVSYFKVHRRPLPIIMLLAGFSVIAAGHLFTAALEAIVVPAGGLTIAAAHFLNNKYGAACQVKGHVHKHA